MSSRTSRSADVAARAYSGSPVRWASRRSTSAAAEFPDGTALSNRSLGRNTSSSASDAVWKNPPLSGSRNSMRRSSARPRASRKNWTSNVVS